MLLLLKLLFLPIWLPFKIITELIEHSGRRRRYARPRGPRTPQSRRRRANAIALTVIAVALLAIIGALAGGGGGASPGHHRSDATTQASVAAGQSLPCHARVSSRRPAVTSDRLQVRTLSHASVTAIARYAASRRTMTAATNNSGVMARDVHVGSAARGRRVTVAVTVRLGARTGHCSTWFKPRRPSRAAAPPPIATPVATPTGCYPLSNEGTCYEPGEYCRDSDHGATGVAGDGEKIICADNDGWRWEPA